ncbi:MAG: 8-amino-7-oxononanoate synthase [Muribaculaceae bacterium]|nr:8-amino-7-oxononanoate synthase [Muribaculaceae bacterium]
MKFEAYKEILNQFESENRLRRIPTDRENPERIDLSGNDYLGLAAACKDEYPEFIRRTTASFSSSASRLLASRQNHFSLLEEQLEKLYRRPALLFNSGYHANVGTISALSIPPTLIVSDKLIHASIIDGIRMGKADNVRWNHNDTSHLRKIIEKYNDRYDRIIVVAESIYSMDGDLGPLKELVELKKQFPKIILYIDEAHAFGVRGEKGLGLTEEYGLLDDIDILICTLGKACASEGAFVITSPLLHSYLINTARPLIFSTALAPINAAWTSEMIRKIISMKNEREKLKEISKDFRNFISRITQKDNPSQSQIVPMLIGDAGKALQIAEALNREGIDALAIRRPTVPPGGERIRFSLNATLSQCELRKVKDAIQKIVK